MNTSGKIRTPNCLVFIFMIVLLINFKLGGQTNTFSISGAGTAAVNGVYVQNGTQNDRPAYVHVNGTYVIYFDASYCVYIIDTDFFYGNELYWYDIETPDFPVSGGNWRNDAGSLGDSPCPTSAQNTTSTMSFTDGSSFSGTCTPNTTNNVIGRFFLKGSNLGGALKALDVNLTGSWSQASNIKLWSSASGTFSAGSSTQCGSTVGSLGSSPNTISFSGFTRQVDHSSGTYFFLTVDLASGASGNILAKIPNQGSFSFAGANSPSSLTNAALSSGGGMALPVELTGITASVLKDGYANLKWKTASEVNNYGFEVERRGDGETRDGVTGRRGDWEKIGFVAGHGNSNVEHEYSYVDDKAPSGKVSYRIKQVDNDGSYKYYEAVTVNVDVPKEYKLLQNSPNPFNPTTAIKFKIPENTRVSIKIYDQIGREVTTLINEEKPSGSHIVYWNGKDKNNQMVSSGVYLYRLTAGSYSETRKMNLLK